MSHYLFKEETISSRPSGRPQSVKVNHIGWNVSIFSSMAFIHRLMDINSSSVVGYIFTKQTGLGQALLVCQSCNDTNGRCHGIHCVHVVRRPNTVHVVVCMVHVHGVHPCGRGTW
jgi:hypothetical protein